MPSLIIDYCENWQYISQNKALEPKPSQVMLHLARHGRGPAQWSEEADLPQPVPELLHITQRSQGVHLQKYLCCCPKIFRLNSKISKLNLKIFKLLLKIFNHLSPRLGSCRRARPGGIQGCWWWCPRCWPAC